ncbi:Cys-tRNA(Pro) deacylase [Clostridium pasteurianum DSM 525 = ATCC 6013]|uniref:Cys-tRNA(Pro)/Cys-tRNA(Cys) deacylase n=1 Tax=Clostridium pasteurianum DSM 525 = ATCC 6013 TaxID=1262449 RepID=A0A0H3J6U4_CLOPA|nr:Cys-tRNA(Pro) deacylase [Clostridium pasteurianum]AJA47638.1 Cys-tRNA(Pro) deacylase [Clostridium pasteurianum DSM 525 = ATCC 6013]AJA51626.1 Cys-tRNA(Pro) deacylase [Clostridium pasteurianum DSM 525 = ATCC 6013]AOZ74947.1 cysteinyl-tRNA(Pro) deacylase [Clostridium pasteurianum DSM 525 = ATCC 6013]AOZ78742.1 cysteinyl-tRNA(Pro) deacylase [Clostridium pasteurianum]ELP58022.1 ybaK/ebsC protein [Clostridium pasteurianum DSM 525 = ATCC 6013]
MSHVKTNAMRILDREKINYDIITYDSSDGKIDGISVTKKLGENPKFVYKTLVLQGNSGDIYIFVTPVEDEIDLKKAAAAAGEKNVKMVAVKDIMKLTGYIRGGCSPIGMKKHYKTFVNTSALDIEKIIVSGGKIGTQIEILTEDLAKVASCEFKDFIK